MSDVPDTNGWREYQKLVLDKLDDHGKRLKCVDARLVLVDEKITTVRVEVAALKVKSGLWGLVAGLFPALGIAIWMFLK